jgi:hypothetical protein
VALLLPLPLLPLPLLPLQQQQRLNHRPRSLRC